LDPSDPDAREGGSWIQGGRLLDGAGPGCWDSSAGTAVEHDEEGVMRNVPDEEVEGRAIPMILAILAMTCVSTGGVIASA
jgi:hypothetical protein